MLGYLREAAAAAKSAGSWREIEAGVCESGRINLEIFISSGEKMACGIGSEMWPVWPKRYQRNDLHYLWNEIENIEKWKLFNAVKKKLIINRNESQSSSVKI